MDLLKLLTCQSEKQLVGTLTLGKSNNFREVFFQGDLVYLVGEHFSGKVAVRTLTELGIPGQRVSMEQFDKAIHQLDRSGRILAEHLHDARLLSEEELGAAAHEQFLEELLDVLFQTRQTFHFDEGRVPEYLLRCEDLTVRVPLQLEEVIASLQQRIDLWSRFESIVPSRDEILVLTERGMEMKQSGAQDFVLAQVLRLVDGMRDLRSILRDNFLYESSVASALLQALDSGLVKKTIHPELKGLSTHSFQRQDAEKFLRWFKNAVKYGVDELAARERLAVVYEKLERIDEAVIQFNYIGDALFRMRKTAKAMKAYQRALQLKPDEILVTEKITRIYTQAAAEELANGNKSQATQFLLGAIKIRPSDRDSFAQVLPLMVEDRKLEELSDVCDWICAHARKTRSIDIALQTCKDILKELPQNAAFRKKLINIYFDCGMSTEASTELQILARQYLQRGQTAKAQELLEKIRRIGTASSELKVLERQFAALVGDKPRSSWSLVAMVFIALLSVYQVFTYWNWSKIAGATTIAEAATEHRAQSAGLLVSREEVDCLNLANDCEVFIARHPLSLWQSQAETVRDRLKHRAKDLELLRVTRKRETLQAATLAANEGKKAEAAQILAPLLDLPEGDPARESARRVLATTTATEERPAQELLAEAQRLQTAGDARAAWRFYRRLLQAYPRSLLLRDLRLPVVIESVPPGAEIHELNELGKPQHRGKTPAVLTLEPGGSALIELEFPGYQKEKVEVQESDGQGKVHFLLRRRSGSVALSGRAQTLPTVTGDKLLCGLQTGGLLEVSIATGKLEWRLKAQDGKTLVAPPVMTPHSLATLWNTGNLVLERVAPAGPLPPGAAATGQELVAELFLGSLATSPLCALKSSELLAVGTKSGQVLAYNASTRAQAWSFDLGSPAEVIAELDSDIVVATQNGFVARVRAGSQSGLAWKRQVVPTGSSSIVELFPTEKSILAVTRRGDILILKSETGETARILTLEPGSKTTLSALERRLYAVTPDGTLSVFAADTAELLRTTKLDAGASALHAFPGGVAVVVPDKRRFVVFAAETLTPLWAAQGAQPIFWVGASAEWILALTEESELLSFRRD